MSVWQDLLIVIGALALMCVIGVVIGWLVGAPDIRLADLDSHDPDCICDDCLLYRDGIP